MLCFVTVVYRVGIFVEPGKLKQKRTNNGRAVMYTKCTHVFVHDVIFRGVEVPGDFQHVVSHKAVAVFVKHGRELPRTVQIQFHLVHRRH